MFDPAKASEQIRSEFIDYITTSYSFADGDLKRKFENSLDEIISKGPYVELNKIFKTGKSIQDLIDEGTLSKEFKNLEKGKMQYPDPDIKLPIDRPLYYHQEQAIRKAVNGDNLIVSTGTGSGKTNCFLIPVINELLKEKELGTLTPGIRAIFIYPMNALANDQIKNLRKILMCYPDITFGVYNGATEEDEEQAIAFYNVLYQNESNELLKHALPNEMLSRSQMKKSPPHILFTNYSMLEHLLFRPKDDVLFSKSDFRFVVLDEAHVYAGATGIETALLIRKMKARIHTSKKVQFILTSATLGGPVDSDEDVLKFGKNLCGEDFLQSSIIRSQRELARPQKRAVVYHDDIYLQLADNKEFVSNVLDKFNIKHDEGKDEELLFDFLSTSNYFQELEKYTGQTLTIDELALNLNCNKEIVISLISIASRAQKNGKQLIDARYHFFVRCLEGCFVSLSPNHNLYLNRLQTDEQEKYQVLEVACCTDCGQYAYVGHIDKDHLVPSNIMDKVEYFYPSFDRNFDIEDENDVEDKEEYYLCPHCGYIKRVNIKTKKQCEHPQEEYIKVYKANNLEIGARCGSCHTGHYRRFFLGYDAATAVLATALYDSMPDFKYIPVKIEQSHNNPLLNIIQTAKPQQKSYKKQFLSFSDSRQQAAKFACYLEDSYQEFLRRRSIYQIISENEEEIKSGQWSIGTLVNMLKNYYQVNHFFEDQEKMQNPNQQAWVAVLNELARFNSKTSLTSLGYLQFSYAGITDQLVQGVMQLGNIDEENARMLCNLLVYELVKDGAISTAKATDISNEEREYIFYSPNQKYSVKEYSSSANINAKGWMPKRKENAKKYYNTYKLYYVKTIFNCDDEEAVQFLEFFYEFLENEDYNQYALKKVHQESSIVYVLPATYFIVNIPGSANAKWYRCKKCGRVSQFHINHHCMTIKCNGVVEEIDSSILHEGNHFAKLYEKSNLTELKIKEHTAQLSKVEALKYQEQFVKEEINALSCSTTFEMGVDVGSLETVFLRDIPPLPSNYTQRAGRAGRSINSAAYILTYAKLSSHDLTYYKNPLSMIEGEINPPLFKIDNEKIIRRHIYSIALALYFKLCAQNNDDQYDHNRINKFVLDKGYQNFIDWLNSHPTELKELIKDSMPDVEEKLLDKLGIDDFAWVSDLIGEKGILTKLIDSFENRRKELNKLIQKAVKEDISKADYYNKKLKLYDKRELVEFLARGNVLPRYGFPVNTVELEQYFTQKNYGKNLTLSRDLQVAIAEYAPSSEVIADGKMYTSRYIKKTFLDNNKSGFNIGYFALCPDCGNINYREIPLGKGDSVDCIFCGKSLSDGDFKESIEPREGFMAEEEVKPVPLSRQEKNYKSEDYYISDIDAQKIEERVYKINGNKIVIQSTENDSLMIKSEKPYYVCLHCGYAVAPDEDGIKVSKREEMRKGFNSVDLQEKHMNQYGKKCDCTKLHRYYLHHVFKTDIVKLHFNSFNENRDTMDSVMYAILYAISDILNIERRDIKGCISRNMNGRYDIIIYDAVPGGAGHSRRILGHNGYVLQKVLEKAYERVHYCSCEPSCYNCLRSYENQKKHDILDRHLAESFLENYVGDIEEIEGNITEIL